MIIAHEWYREFYTRKLAGAIRDCEEDAEEAFAPDEKVYEQRP